jgi:hypothetical protein
MKYLIMLLWLVAYPVWAEGIQSTSPIVNDYIATQNQLAHLQGNSVTLWYSSVADMNNDGKPDYVIAYTRDGSTWMEIHFAVFVKTPTSLVLSDDVVIRAFSADNITVNNAIISAKLIQWADNDPHCCPTVHTTAKFKLVAGKIVDY